MKDLQTHVHVVSAAVLALLMFACSEWPEIGVDTPDALNTDGPIYAIGVTRFAFILDDDGFPMYADVHMPGHRHCMRLAD